MILGQETEALRLGAYDGVSETTLTAEYVYMLPFFLDFPMRLRRIAHQSQWADVNGTILRLAIYQGTTSTGNVNALPSGSSGSIWKKVSPTLLGTSGSWLAASPTHNYADFANEVRLVPKRNIVYGLAIKPTGGDLIISGVDGLVRGHVSAAAFSAGSDLTNELRLTLNQNTSPAALILSAVGARGYYGSIRSLTVVG